MRMMSSVDLLPPSHLEDRAPALQSDVSSLEQFVFEFGHQWDSYLATSPERKIFWSSNYQGLVSYKRYGRHVLVAGGLIGPSEERPRLLQEFLQFTAAHRWRPMFFCVPPEDLPLFQKMGWAINKLGEDPILPLGNVTFTGKHYDWVRRRSNFCQRHGVWFEELRPDDFSELEWSEILREVQAVTRETMGEKAQASELTFFDGTMENHELGCRRLFVARTESNGTRRIEGYVVCNPMQGGRAWSMEIYRHRSDAVRGTIAFLFHQIILRFQEEGVELLNLCLLPARNCEEPIPGEKAIVRHCLGFLWKHCSLLFDVQGLDHFKGRFRPQYQNSYLCTPAEKSIVAVLVTIHAFGMFRLSPLKLIRLAMGRLRKQRTHTPAAE